MATFSLKDTINRTNNPSSDGVFEYGYFNDAGTFVRFDSYGYTDGSGTPPVGGPFDVSKILGWYDSTNSDTDVAIAFENISGSLAITPQPFPATGIYIHPLGPPASNTKRMAIRMYLPSSGLLSATGTIQAASVGCGEDIGYRIRVNNTTDILPRTILTKSTTPTNITLSNTSVVLGDYVDLIIDTGDDGNYYCDDTAIDIAYTVTLSKMPVPLLQDDITCTSTSATYITPLQTEGSVELYEVGNSTPIATVNIVQNGYNGVATFTGLDFSAGGDFYVIAKNTGQDDSDESAEINITPCYSGTATDDNVGVKVIGQSYTINVALNDTPCSVGTTTYELVEDSSINLLNVSFSGSIATYNLLNSGAFSFSYNLLCDGNIVDTGLVYGTACTIPTITTQPSSGVLCSDNTITLNVSTTGDNLTYQWRESGTNIVGATASSYIVDEAGTYSVVVSNQCGSVTSNNAIITIEYIPTIVSGSNLPNATTGTNYSHSIVIATIGIVNLTNIIKPTWLTVEVGNNSITLSGTPTLSDLGNNIPVSFNITNTCGTTPFSDTFNIINSCVNVSNGVVNGNNHPTVNTQEIYTVTNIVGTAPHVYNWVVEGGTIISGQGTSTIVVQW